MRVARRVVLVALALVVTVAVGAWWAAGQWSAADHHSVGSPPADLPAQPVEFTNPAGDTLRGWFVPGEPRRGAVVLMHGSHATRRSLLGQARLLHAHGYALLMFDFAAYGESSGAGTTFGRGEAADAAAAVALLRQLASGERLGAIGFSLGGAAALLGDQPLDVDALVLEAVYADIRDAVAHRLRLRFGAVGQLLEPLLTWQVEPRLGIRLDQLRPVDAIGRVHVPVLIIAGGADPRATVTDAERLFAAAHEPKNLWIVPGAAHENFLRFAPDEYQRRVLPFLTRYLRE